MDLEEGDMMLKTEIKELSQVYGLKQVKLSGLRRLIRNDIKKYLHNK